MNKIYLIIENDENDVVAAFKTLEAAEEYVKAAEEGEDDPLHFPGLDIKAIELQDEYEGL